MKNGYKLARRKGSEMLFHTEGKARVCKGVGIERAWPPGHSVERAVLCGSHLGCSPSPKLPTGHAGGEGWKPDSESSFMPRNISVKITEHY